MFSTRETPVRASTLFIYVLSVTALVFLSKSTGLYLVALLNFTLGVSLSYRNKTLIKIFAVFVLLTLWGVLISSLMMVNVGEPILNLGFLVIRRSVLNALINIGARLLAIMGSTLIFISQTNPYHTLKSLENDLKLPKYVVFPTAYALRLIPLIRRDYENLVMCRAQRGFRKTPLTPIDVLTILRPLLSLSYERAVWAGVAAELRGLNLRKPWREKMCLKKMDLVFYTLLVTQIIAALSLR